MKYGSDLVIDFLAAAGIEYVALNPGATFRGLHDSLVYAGHPKPVITLHEEIAVGIAHGYAKSSKRPMATFIHNLVGLQHASRAIFNAWIDNVPILVLGGSGPRYRNFYIARDANRNNFFQDNQLVARTFSYTRTMRESMAGATTVAQRNTPPLFGVGLFERISEDAIKANADPFDGNGDGISGRVNLDGNRVGRFGYKAQESGLEDFIRGPLFNHMGVTSNPLSQLAQVPTTDQPTRDQDGVNDPEISRADISDMLIWLQELAPPAPLPMDSIAMRGEQVFSMIGCNKCHIKNLVVSGARIDAYTDLLLHDMGPGLADGISMSLAGGNEFRTQPLWGLRHHAPYLHDGRADTVDEAILAHGGEGLAARTEYTRLDGDDRQSLLRFLETR